MVSPLGMETIVEEGGGKQAEAEVEAGVELLDDLPRATASFVGVGSDEVEVELIEGSLSQELGAVVGLPGDVREVDAAALQVGLNTLREQGAGLGGAVGGIGEKLQAAADLAGGVLHRRQAAPLHWRPVARDVVEILGVGGDLLEQGPGFFYRRV